MRKAYLGVGGLATLLLAAHSAPAFAAADADATATATSGSPAALQEVVVTARRRSENVEKVPATVQVVTAAALIKQSIHTEGDLQMAAPGLLVRTANTSNLINFSIRGESLDAYSGSAPGVQPYINEVPTTAYTPTTFFDLGGVQVLKGPQGTLFGRNSTGGAVLFTTQQPTNQFGGYVSVQYGNLGKLITEAAVNLPIAQDKVLLRIAGVYSQGGAFAHNLWDGSTLGDEQTSGMRATLLLRPVEKLTNTFSAEFDHTVGRNVPNFLHYVVPCGQPEGGNTCIYNTGNPVFNSLVSSPTGTYLPGYPGGYVFPGGMPNLLAFNATLPRYTVDEDSKFINKSLNVLIGNTTEYEFSPTFSVKNVFGYNRVHSESSYDDDATPYPILTTPVEGALEQTIVEQISDEFQIQGKAFDNRLTYIAGFFFDDQKTNFLSPLVSSFFTGGNGPPPPPSGSTFVPFPLAYNNLAEDRSYAIFTQATFAITDKLNFTGGVRQTWDDLSQRQETGGFYYGFNGPGCITGVTVCAPGDDHHLSTSENDQSWTVSLDYHWTPELMTYVTTRGSWRVGGYEPAGPPGGNTVSTVTFGDYFLPEKIRDVEAGVKYNGAIGGIPTQINADFFNTWVSNIQKNAYVLIDGAISSATINVPKAEVTGVEGDFQIKPTSWLRLGGSLSYVDARFTQPHTILFGAPVTYGPYGDTPRYSGSVFTEVVVPLQGNAGTLTWHTDFYGQSSFNIGNLGNTLTPNVKVPGYGVVNMRLDWSDPFGFKGLTVSGFAKNLGDKLYFTGGNAGAADFSTEAFTYAPPRTYGFVLRYDF
jgi:iron complex outermembrane receptor protein